MPPVVGSSARFRISNLSIRSDQGISVELAFAETDRGPDHSGYPVLTQSLHLPEAPNQNRELCALEVCDLRRAHEACCHL